MDSSASEAIGIRADHVFLLDLEVCLQLCLDPVNQVLEMVLLESELAGICDQVDDSAELLHLNKVSFSLEVSHDLAEPLLLLVFEESLLPLQGFDLITSKLDDPVHFFES